jgi:glycosyltransferase involved in cell wall biosynthesis
MRGVVAKLDENRVTDSARSGDGAGGSKLLRGVCLLVTDIDAPSGGVQKNSRLLLKKLNERGIATYACARNYHGLPADEMVDGTLVHRCRIVRRRIALNGILYFLGTIRWLIRHRRNYDVIHCQQMFGPTMAAAVASFFIDKPIVTRVTTVGELSEVKQIRELPLSGLRLRLIRRVSRWVALTSEMKRELIGMGIQEQGIKIIHNSTELPTEWGGAETKTRLRQELGLPAVKIGVFIGRLSDEKNLDVLIEAWLEVRQEFPGARLLIVGAGGAYRNVEGRLRELVSVLDLDSSVLFVGHVDRAKDYVMASDVFVLPSRTEGMSNALLEALACGAPIVATDIPGNAEICTDVQNALLVPVGDSHAMAHAIKKLFSSPDFARQLGMAARRKAQQDLSVDTMVDKYLAVYRDVLQAS